MNQTDKLLILCALVCLFGLIWRLEDKVRELEMCIVAITKPV